MAHVNNSPNTQFHDISDHFTEPVQVVNHEYLISIQLGAKEEIKKASVPQRDGRVKSNSIDGRDLVA